MRLEELVVNARNPRSLAFFWVHALGWSLRMDDDEAVAVVPPPHADGTPRYPELLFVRVDEPEVGQERIHLDLNSPTLEDQAATVARLLALGATHADVGQAADAEFVVLADPEGNHLCIIEPRPEYAHLGFEPGYTLAAHDANALAPFWELATGWHRTRDEPGYVVLTPPDGGGPLEIITRPTMPRSDAPLRSHLDVTPSRDEDQAAVVERLLAAGATHADVGQSGEESWVVLADPEGNELCVLSPRD